ncbi:MAG: hypothetical protein JNG83_13770 [Opitutaceae bacterium]|nr:hypothetical protein [Opitutaceae bacterium]
MKPNPLNLWREGAPMPLPRAGCAAGVLGGRLIVAGGTYWSDGQKYWSDRVDAYDVAGNRWEPLAPLPQPRGDAPTVVVDDTLYILGGGVDGPAVTSVVAYRAGAWSTLPRLALPAPRRSSVAAVVDGTIYLLGGLAGTWTEFASLTATVWAARPGAAWETRAPLPGPARFNAAVGVVGGRILLAGGCAVADGKVVNLDEVLAYEPRADRWSVIGRLPQPLRGACGLADGDRLLVVGGYTDRFLTQVLAVDGAGKVAVAGELPVGLADTRFHRVGAQIVGATGENGIKLRFPGVLVSG